MLTDLFHRLRSLLRRRAVEADLDDELRFHRERQLDAYRQAGLTPDEARRRLGIEFGGLDQIKEEHRQSRGVSIVEHFVRDVRYGWRGLLKAPGFTLVAVATLGLGLGANTAIFSVVYSVLLRPLPYKDPSRVVVLNETTPRVGDVSVSYPNFLDWRERSRTLSASAFVVDIGASLSGIGQAESISIEAVSSNFLSMLGVRPFIGRDFTAAEDSAGTPPVAMLSYELWQSHFAGDHSVLQQPISLDGRPYKIVGVLPAGFSSTTSGIGLFEPIGVWLTKNDGATSRGSRGDSIVIGRLAPGVTLDRARSEMDGITASLARAYPESNAGFGAALQPVRDLLVGSVRPALLVLFGAVFCVLLIACANVASLSLIRGAGRRREIALRLAIGASRRRVISQLLIESAIVASLGGVVGLALAFGGIRGLAWLMTMDTLGVAVVRPNGVVFGFAAAAVIVTTIVFGLAPALQSVNVDVQSDLKEGQRGGHASRRHQRWRAALVIVEVSLALVLLVGAGLLIRSLSRLMAVDPGIQTDRRLTTHLNLRTSRYASKAAAREFWDQVIERASHLPGVDAAALGRDVPFTNDYSRADISIDGLDFSIGAFPHPDVHAVSPGYAAVLGIRLLHGRMFTDADTEQTMNVGIVNRSLAEKFFGQDDPTGRRFAMGRVPSGPSKSWITIVGVVEDTRLYGLDNPSRLEIYRPLRQSTPHDATLILETRADPAALVAPLRETIASLDRDLPLIATATLNDLRDRAVSTRHITLVLLGLFSALSLVLAAIGIYGVMSYAVAQRSAELGIRLALGATWTNLLMVVMTQGAAIAGAGVLVGIAASVGLTRLLQQLLFAVSAIDPATFLTVAFGVAVVTLLACLIPAWRALRVDPLIVLRRE